MKPDVLSATLPRIRDRLARLPGITGIALGGSRARGAAHPDSDIDIGLYYDAASRPAFEEVLNAAADLDDHGTPAGHGSFGEWGRWINGGVWLTVDGVRTDILLRDHDRVDEVVREVAEGIITVDYQPGHPHGFVSAIYAGEVWHNQPLHDPKRRLATSREYVDPYPDALAEAIVSRFGWEVGFCLENAAGPARRGNVVDVTGLLYRAIACMNHVLFARNRRFLLNEKGALAEASQMPRSPSDYRLRVEAVLGGLSAEPQDLQRSIESLREIYAEVSR